jgi:hypothetical protein
MARKGLEMAINDILEQVSDWPLERVRSTDADLKLIGVISLSEMRRRFSVKFRQILKRGKIKSTQEYFLVKSVAESHDTEVSPSDRQRLQQLLLQFESS